ncbi:NAD(P)/FAD-dependent oxidoreductase (plasmid) [Rhizobium rosettiformans]|uniref:Thioredoxin reductase n=1 Tax=Rhizobium rosettiformans TaxID=1368430 RepID=A0ABX7F1Z8_9HYPH|nr:NAD(P)/FAD-dependent oxidoreductase [Rhizobium rosettiformans]QRF54478.1 NAD(P)/FAD-dependent oxidoreductase [Rhizobium rosettiformans]
MDGDERELDCAVIGGGPAGLTAALYLARYQLKVTVFDDGLSRAAAIPFSHNVPGFPEGIRGVDMLSRMRDHALRYGAHIAKTFVTGVSRIGSRFLVSVQGRQIEARAVMMATGVTDRRPKMPVALHDAAVSEGLLRYCPICDGYEVSDRKIAIIGAGSHAYSEALFLRSFTRDLWLVSPEGDFDLSKREISSLKQLGVQLVAGPMIDITLSGKSIRIAGAGGVFDYDAAYPALGCDNRSGLAKMVGAELTSDGCIKVDKHLRSTIPYLYAAGDTVAGLNQISSAVGQAAIAATAIRNDLSKQVLLCR